MNDTSDTSDTITRAFELPLEGAEPAVWECLRRAWCEAADLANWCLRHLLARDVVRLPGMKTIKDFPPQPRWPQGGLNRVAREAFETMKEGSWWAGQSGSFAAITKMVQDHWTKHRTAVLWHGTEAPPVWRRPAPFPVRGQEWTAAGFDEAGKPWVEVNLPSGTPRKPLKARLRLRGGPEFGRQLGLFRQTVALFEQEFALRKQAKAARRKHKEEYPWHQLVIFPRPASNSCHRKRLGGDRVMVKMVARLPRPEARSGRTLVLETDPGAFWVATLDGRPAWVLNNDHFKRAHDWLEAHKDRRQRLAEDRKAERRLQGDRGAAAQRRLEKACLKHARRLSSWLHESAAHLAGFAGRQGVGEVLYLDRDAGFMSAFPWHRLHGLLADKLAALGVAFYSETSLRLSGGVDFGDLEDGGVTADIQPGPQPEDEKWQRIARLRERATGRLAAAKRRKGSHPAVSAP